MIIRSRAPLRLGLAGGGTDVSPYCDNFGGYVLNATIDRYAYTVLETLDSSQLKFCATDQKIEFTQSIEQSVTLDGNLNLHKAVYSHMVENYNNGNNIPLVMSTFCDAPAGSGLGSSSTLVVSMIKAFVEYFNIPLDDYAIASLAYKIEREVCGLQGGRQDQYSATFGGFNFMEFYSEGRTIVNPLRIKNWIVCELEASLLLYFTGVSRESAKIISDQSNNVDIGLESAISAMNELKREAVSMKECLLRGEFTGVVESMRFGWENKKKSSSAVSNDDIDTIYMAACEAGALAGKVSGAGGGGFMCFFVPADKRMDVVRSLNQFGGQVSNCHFTNYGTQAWRLF